MQLMIAFRGDSLAAATQDRHHSSACICATRTIRFHSLCSMSREWILYCYARWWWWWWWFSFRLCTETVWAIP